jgi:amidohydrolase
MSIIKQRIEQFCRIYHSEVVAIRRHIHKNPELSFQEEKTAKFISNKLTEYGIPHETNIAKNGIVGIIKGKDKSKVLALRADIDALPIEEQNQSHYKSINPGVMHACGHDAHTAMLLGAAKILNEIKDSFSGTIKLIFQPAEEKLPGGALQMIDEGVLENPKVQNIIGQHVYPNLEEGKVGFRSGKYMASTDEIYLTVKGKGGHAAMPDENIDAVLIAAHIITALQQVVSRNASPIMPSILSFGKIIANGATNIIPDKVEIEGTFRTFDEDWRMLAHEKIQNIASKTAEAMGGECDVNIIKGYPFLNNDQAMTENMKRYAIEYLGEKNVVDLDLRMTAEDFAYYSHEIPACFYRIGTRNEKRNIISSLHTSTFDIDENALYTGMGLMAYLAYRQIEEMPF